MISRVSPESSLEKRGGGELDFGENAPYRWGSKSGELRGSVAAARGGDDGNTASLSMVAQLCKGFVVGVARGCATTTFSADSSGLLNSVAGDCGQNAWVIVKNALVNALWSLTRRDTANINCTRVRGMTSRLRGTRVDNAST